MKEDQQQQQQQKWFEINWLATVAAAAMAMAIAVICAQAYQSEISFFFFSGHNVDETAKQFDHFSVVQYTYSKSQNKTKQKKWYKIHNWLGCTFFVFM